LRDQKIAKAFILVSGAPKFEIFEKCNGAIKFVSVPTLILDNSHLSDFYINLFLEQFLGKHVNLPCGDQETSGLVDLLCRVAGSNASVLINGPTGTGKEVVARLLHAKSYRSQEPFIAVNCAAIPENMLESMLFGHEKGAYTGASRQRIGRFEQADRGTLFHDEIGDMSLATQAKLLRVLQEREFERLGGDKTIKVDARIISASNKDLAKIIQEGDFREDLF
jgi:two-component system response regulator FlrC